MNSFLVVTLVSVAATFAGCSHLQAPDRQTSAQEIPSIESLIALVRSDPAKKPLLARSLVNREVLVIPDPHSRSLSLLPFYQNERSFIPVFSDRKVFDEEAYGTGFAGKAVPVDGGVLASLLKGDEIVILNPGHRPAIEFAASELKSSTR